MTQEKTEKPAPKKGLTPDVCMTQTQFDALMRIMRVTPDSKTREGLFMVLVQGSTLYEAARKLQAEGNTAAPVKVNTGTLARELTRARAVMADVALLHYPAIRLPTRRKGQRLGK